MHTSLPMDSNGPFFQSALASTLGKCDFYSVSFDESLNKIAQKGQMDIVVRFWRNDNIEQPEVSTRYLTSTFFKHAASTDLRSYLRRP